MDDLYARHIFAVETSMVEPWVPKTFSKCAAAYPTSRPAWRRCNGLLKWAHDLIPVPYSEECGCHDQTVLQHSIAARPGASRIERGDRKQSGGVAVRLRALSSPDYGARERNCCREVWQIPSSPTPRFPNALRCFTDIGERFRSKLHANCEADHRHAT